MHSAGAVTDTDLVTVDDDAITCWARINLDGDWIRFTRPTTRCSTDTAQVYVRGQGQRLRKGGKVKAGWIAENIGEDFPQDYKVDEASATVESQNAHGAFMLARPEAGWAIGDYRVEFYVDDVFVDAAKLKIVK